MVFLKSEAAKPIDPFSFPLNIFSLGQIRPRITASYTETQTYKGVCPYNNLQSTFNRFACEEL